MLFVNCNYEMSSLALGRTGKKEPLWEKQKCFNRGLLVTATRRAWKHKQDLFLPVDSEILSSYL